MKKPTKPKTIACPCGNTHEYLTALKLSCTPIVSRLIAPHTQPSVSTVAIPARKKGRWMVSAVEVVFITTYSARFRRLALSERVCCFPGECAGEDLFRSFPVPD